MSGPVWTLPAPSEGTSGVPASDRATQDAQFFGEDIWYDVTVPNAITGEADYVETPAGDLLVATGREALRQSLIRRLITRPREWPTLPDFGVGAGDYVKARNTPAVRAELESRIRSQYLRDPRVHTVDLVTTTPLDDGSPGVKIAVTVTPTGRLRMDRPLTVQVEVR